MKKRHRPQAGFPQGVSDSLRLANNGSAASTPVSEAKR
jgi:hypothetical protein